MKTMKKLVAALLVLTMVLALTGSAMAACKFQKGDKVKFVKNVYVYDNHRESSKTSTIVHKGSISVVVCTWGSNWVKLRLNENDTSKDRWFKADDLKATNKTYDIVWNGNVLFSGLDIYVTYSNGGVGGSSVWATNLPDIYSDTCLKHVKATAKVWMHKEPSLKKNYGRALHKDDKVTYRRVFGVDDRYVVFFGIKYKGKCLWVSSEYTKLVK